MAEPGAALGVGLSLPPDPVSLTILWPLIEAEADYYEVAPETLWRPHREGWLSGNRFRERFLQLKRESGRPFVGHGVGLSMAHPDPVRRARWLAQLRQDHADFGFCWYTDHLGWPAAGAVELTLPLAAPDTPETHARLVQTLRDLQAIVPLAGLENSASYMLPYPPLREPTLIGEVLAAADGWLLLDLHNLLTMAQNMGFSAEAWLERAPLHRVIEIHVSGGRDSRVGWLPERRTLHLDSHDDAVPDGVWALLARARPHCVALRGITLEYMEGTFTTHDLPRMRAELDRMRASL